MRKFSRTKALSFFLSFIRFFTLESWLLNSAIYELDIFWSFLRVMQAMSVVKFPSRDTQLNKIEKELLRSDKVRMKMKILKGFLPLNFF